MVKDRCYKGKSCGASCISRYKVCLKELGLEASRSTVKVRGIIKGSRKKSKVPAESTRRVSESSRQAASEILSKYKKGEPKTTALMEKMAKGNNLDLVSLKNRLKSEDSLARKIEGEKHGFGGDAKKTAESLSDVNRYTMKVPQGTYGQSVKNVLDALKEQGFEIRIKNYWSPNAGPYRGINVALTAPDGRKMELQFHTAASLALKSKTRQEYEEFRVSRDNKRRKEIWDSVVTLSKTIPLPSGALDIGGPEALKVTGFRPI